MRPAAISTTITLPSAIPTGPSGKTGRDVCSSDLRTAGDIDALDRPAGIIGGGAVRDQQPIRLDPAETTVVAAIELAVGADREAVGAAAGFGHGLLGAIGTDAGDAARGDLDHDHAAVGHRDRAFGKAQARGDRRELAHGIIPFLLILAAPNHARRGEASARDGFPRARE